MPDPLSLIFVPGGTAAAIVLFGTPLVLLLLKRWRHVARRRNRSFRCARCEAPLAIDDLYLLGGAHVCGDCATTWRRRLRVAVPAALVVAAGLAVSSFSALVASTARGGPGLAWWLDSRWIPLLLPSVGLAAATLLAMRLGIRANARRRAAAWAELEDGDARRWDLFRLRSPSDAVAEGAWRADSTVSDRPT